jgi:hypothetical protein
VFYCRAMAVRVLIAVAAVLAVGGCGGSDEEGQGTGAATAPAATAPASDPFGEYEREVSADEITTTEGQEAPPPGTWHLTLGPSVFQVVDAGGFRFSQELALNGEEFEIGRYLGGDGVFCEDDQASTYRWEHDGDQLVLVAIDDACPDRKMILESEWNEVG